jgi:hypothetical protein
VLIDREPGDQVLRVLGLVLTYESAARELENNQGQNLDLRVTPGVTIVSCM